MRHVNNNELNSAMLKKSNTRLKEVTSGLRKTFIEMVLKLLSIGIDAGGLTKTPWTRYANRMPQFAAHPRFVLAMSAGRSIGSN